MRNQIIILDKNDINRSALKNILCTEYTISETNSVTECFALLKEAGQEIAAILIDMLTSEQDGLDLLKVMKENA